MVELEHIPVLRLTPGEMEDPIGFLSQPNVRRLGHLYGMVKLVPPQQFKPPLSIDETKFKFRARLQHLNELNISNRGRLFLMKQLNNFHMKGKRKLCVEFTKPYTESHSGRIYFYDLFIAVMRQFNAGVSKANETIGGSQMSFSGRKRPRSRRADETNTTTSKSTSKIILAPLAEIHNHPTLWKDVSKTLGIPADELSDTFHTFLAPYYDFLQRQMGPYGDHASMLSKLIYTEIYPKSLLNDSDDSADDGDDDDEEEEEEGCIICHRNSHRSKTILCDSCDKPFHIFCLDPPLNNVPKGKWACNNCIFGNGFYGFKEENKFYTRQSFQNHCREFDLQRWPNGGKLDNLNVLEAMFWDKVNEIDKTSSIRYGADIHNVGPGQVTGFPTAEFVPPEVQQDQCAREKYSDYVQHPMNLVNLPAAKGSLLSVFGKKISGMTVPWIYIGSTFSTFCWHLEDQYTLSANYQHEGDPKIWYSVPESSREKFDELMKSIAPDLFQKQPDLLHQLVTLIAPYDKRFQDANISCYKAVQYPGEYIVTFPKCYHSGFNTGYNFNEAVNFTLDLWLPYGVEATHDYIATGKKCVFNMWELMLTVLLEYLENPRKFDEVMVRRCHSELLEMFNREVKTLDQLSDVIRFQNQAKGFTRRHIDDKLRLDIKVTVTSNSSYDDEYVSAETDSDAESDDGDDDIFCSACKTICPFAFVAHCKSSRLSKRRRLQSMKPEELNLLAENGDIDILCAQDYFRLVEQIDEDEHGDNSSDQRFEHDELYFIRQPDEIRDILKRAQNKIDSMLR
ncbi:LAME_0D00782g1_1 [Lachancea meyersii CBS 8951]|uniref:LAME_0D00782g1_1 n=1 Tax=Lachancea meyersii CBS 8951 TaxID=1266667 RepID=A0A1G4J6A9_9SACH|nr:LAME_0D00782g1_1 [Lachancea meyersii CBS 8951]